MTIDALLVLQRSDVEHIASQPERYAGTKLLFTDPGVFDHGVQSGLQNYEMRWVDVGADSTLAAHAESTSTAESIDLALTALRREFWGDAVPLHGWDQGLLYHPLQRCHAARQLARGIEKSWPEARIGLLRPSNPALSHWDSMLTTDIVAADPARWAVVGSYEKALYWNPNTLEVCFDFGAIRAEVEAGRADCVTHIPTCFYDAPAFEAAIAANFATNIDLPGTDWDVPVRRRGTYFLQWLTRVPADADCIAYRERVRQVYLDRLAALIPARAALLKQADTFARRSHLQAVNYTGLRRALAGSRPHFVVSDHDTGCNGPLYSVAAELGSEITVLPHSAYPTSRMPHARRVTVIERDGVGVPVTTVLGERVRTRAVRFRPSPAPPERPAPGRVCLLLNSMTGDGLSYVDLFALIRFYKALSTLCAETGWDLVVRLKPSAPALNVVAAAFGTAPGGLVRTMQQPIDEVAREADICVAYGEPTSATIAFFNAGSLMVHVSDEAWPCDYRITNPLSALMPTERGDAAVRTLAGLMRDPGLYSSIRERQMSQYRQRCTRVHDTIFGGRAASDLESAAVPSASC